MCIYTNDYAFPFRNYTERERIEAQIKAADMALRLKVEAEKKQQRERDREAARIALQKVIHPLLTTFIMYIFCYLAMASILYQFLLSFRLKELLISTKILRF